MTNFPWGVSQLPLHDYVNLLQTIFVYIQKIEIVDACVILSRLLVVTR